MVSMSTPKFMYGKHGPHLCHARGIEPFFSNRKWNDMMVLIIILLYYYCYSLYCLSLIYPLKTKLQYKYYEQYHGNEP